jgi:hypothetical protein
MSGISFCFHDVKQGVRKLAQGPLKKSTGSSQLDRAPREQNTEQNRKKTFLLKISLISRVSYDKATNFKSISYCVSCGFVRTVQN